MSRSGVAGAYDVGWHGRGPDRAHGDPRAASERLHGAEVFRRKTHLCDIRDALRVQAMQIEGNLAASRSDESNDGLFAKARAGLYLIRCDDACPGLHEGRFGIACIVLHREKVASLVPVQNFPANHHVLRKPTGNGVAECQAFSLVIDIGLDDEAIAKLELPLPRVAHADNRQGHLMAGHRRGLGQIPPFDAGVRATRRDQLDI